MDIKKKRTECLIDKDNQCINCIELNVDTTNILIRIQIVLPFNV